jgi:hypothetical protein
MSSNRIEADFASVVVNGTSKPSIDVGIDGREGMTGLAVVRGNDRLPHEKVAGRCQRISAAKLQRCLPTAAARWMSVWRAGS